MARPFGDDDIPVSDAARFRGFSTGNFLVDKESDERQSDSRHRRFIRVRHGRARAWAVLCQETWRHRDTLRLHAI